MDIGADKLDNMSSNLSPCSKGESADDKPQSFTLSKLSRLGLTKEKAELLQLNKEES